MFLQLSHQGLTSFLLMDPSPSSMTVTVEMFDHKLVLPVLDSLLSSVQESVNSFFDYSAVDVRQF